MNFWFWLLIILTPLIVFSEKPEQNLWLRLSRLVLAAALCYVLMFVTVYSQHRTDIDAINAFVDKFPRCADQLCANAPRPALNGPILGVVFLLGWIPATGYTGLWELIWRLRYHARIKKMGKSFEGKRVSNIVIGSAFVAAKPTWLFLSSVAY